MCNNYLKSNGPKEISKMLENEEKREKEKIPPWDEHCVIALTNYKLEISRLLFIFHQLSESCKLLLNNVVSRLGLSKKE